MLEELAKEYNYPPQEFITAIATGEIALVLLPDEQRSWACQWLEKQANTIEDISLKEAIESIVRQLRAAIARDEPF